MSENNIEEKEILEDQITNEESTDEGKKPSFFKALIARVVDEVTIGILSVIILFLFEALLKIGGYLISQKISMLFIIFVLVSIIYNSVMEANKNGRTLGKKLLGI